MKIFFSRPFISYFTSNIIYLYLILFFYHSSHFTNGYRGAIVLTMAGRGAPEYLSWSCETIGASSQLFDMLIFHEDNELIQEMHCPTNVIKINLGKDGMSTLISAALLRETPPENSKLMKLAELIPIVIRKFPYFLAEFKTGTGDIFQNYLKGYTHWTYTDPDIFWGNLTQTILKSELEIYDLITFSQLNDGDRLFLRGQFSLHKNREDLNKQWKSLPQFELNLLAERMQNIVLRLSYLDKKKLSSNEEMLNQIKSRYFVSAEGAYSTLIFNTYRKLRENLHFDPKNKNNYKVLIAGRMMSDKITKPVVWKDGVMFRCSCKYVDDCLRQSPITEQDSHKTCLYEQKRAESVDLVPLFHLKPLTTEISGDCAMGWISPPYRLCGSSTVRKRYNEVVLDDGKWYFNDERTAPRRELFSGAFFHFRLWEDIFSNHIQTIQPTETTSSCLITYLSLAVKEMHVLNCDARQIPNKVQIMTYRDFQREKAEEEEEEE